MLYAKQIVDSATTPLASASFLASDSGWNVQLNTSTFASSANKGLTLTFASGTEAAKIGNASLSELGPINKRQNVLADAVLELSQTHIGTSGAWVEGGIGFHPTDGASNISGTPIKAYLRLADDGAGDGDLILTVTGPSGDQTISLGKFSSLGAKHRLRIQVVRATTGDVEVYFYVNGQIEYTLTGKTEADLGIDVGIRPFLAVYDSGGGYPVIVKRLFIHQLPVSGAGGGGSSTPNLILPPGWTAEVRDYTGIDGSAYLVVTDTGGQEYWVQMTKPSTTPPTNWDAGFSQSEGFY